MKKVTSLVLNNFKNDSRVLKENISLHNAGYDVIVVALHEEPLQEHENVKNIPVHRIKLKTRNWSKNKLIQIVKYLEFIYRSAKEYKKSDIFHCNDLSTLPVGVIVKKFLNKNAKIVYDAHEYETELTNLRGVRKKLVKFLERRLIGHADKVLTVSDSIANEYVRLYNIKKPALVLNTPPYKDLDKQNIFREEFGIKQEQKIFLYQGGLAKGRGIEILLDAFASFWREQQDESAVIVFMGYGQLESKIIELAKEHKTIYFHPAVSPEVLLNYTSSTDFGIATIEDSCLSYRYCLPNKLFEYIMAEIPVIVSNLPEMRKLVTQNQIGSIVEHNDAQGVKNAIRQALTMQSEGLVANIKKLKNIYNWEAQERILLETYRELYEN